MSLFSPLVLHSFSHPHLYHSSTLLSSFLASFHSMILIGLQLSFLISDKFPIKFISFSSEERSRGEVSFSSPIVSPHSWFPPFSHLCFSSSLYHLPLLSFSIYLSSPLLPQCIISFSPLPTNCTLWALHPSLSSTLFLSSFLPPLSFEAQYPVCVINIAAQV